MGLFFSFLGSIEEAEEGPCGYAERYEKFQGEEALILRHSTCLVEGA